MHATVIPELEKFWQVTTPFRWNSQRTSPRLLGRTKSTTSKNCNGLQYTNRIINVVWSFRTL